jgi:hypothetical protein
MRCYTGGIRKALLAWVGTAAVLFASAGPLVAGHLAIDKDCTPASPALNEAHDHAAHRLSQSPEPVADHCAACHLTRSVRHAAYAQAFFTVVLTQSPAAQCDAVRPYRADLRTDFTRGPPR